MSLFHSVENIKLAGKNIIVIYNHRMKKKNANKMYINILLFIIYINI